MTMNGLKFLIPALLLAACSCQPAADNSQPPKADSISAARAFGMRTGMATSMFNLKVVKKDVRDTLTSDRLEILVKDDYVEKCAMSKVHRERYKFSEGPTTAPDFDELLKLYSQYKKLIEDPKEVYVASEYAQDKEFGGKTAKHVATVRDALIYFENRVVYNSPMRYFELSTKNEELMGVYRLKIEPTDAPTTINDERAVDFIRNKLEDIAKEKAFQGDIKFNELNVREAWYWDAPPPETLKPEDMFKGEYRLRPAKLYVCDELKVDICIDLTTGNIHKRETWGNDW